MTKGGIYAVFAFVALLLILPESAPDNRAFVENALLEKIAEEGSARAIIVLRGSFSSSNIHSALGLQPSELKIKHRFAELNIISANLTAKALEKLRNSNLVKEIRLSKILSIALDTSVPLIKADQVWNLVYNGENITGKNQAVCIVDTGVDYLHNALGGLLSYAFVEEFDSAANISEINQINISGSAAKLNITSGNYVLSGNLTSAGHQTDYPITKINATWNAAYNNLLAVHISLDNGTSWTAVANNTLYTFSLSQANKVLLYRVLMERGTAQEKFTEGFDSTANISEINQLNVSNSEVKLSLSNGNYSSNGNLTSKELETLEPITQVIPIWSSDVPSSTSMQIKISVDNGTTWQDAQNNTPINFSLNQANRYLVYRVLMNTTNTSVSPVLYGLELNYTQSFSPVMYNLTIRFAQSRKVIAGYDYVNSDSDPMDDNNHGTHCAGIVASEHATYKGVAPGASIIALKCLDSNGDGTEDDIAAAIQWCTDNAQTYNIKVISMSLGDGGSYSSSCPTSSYPLMTSAINEAYAAGLYIVAAAGNDGSNGVSYPACHPNVTAVGATTDSDSMASFSQRGPFLDIVAPGVSIISTIRNNGMASMQGTSMSTPHIAGVAALLFQYEHLVNNRSPKQEQIEALIIREGIPIYDSSSGRTYYRVDALETIKSVLKLNQSENSVQDVEGAEAKIVFGSETNLTKASQAIIIEPNLVSVNSETYPQFNKSATIYLFNLPYAKQPIVIKDGVACEEPLCNITSYSNGILVFDVAHFTNYSSAPNSKLVAWHSGNASQLEEVFFYANYTWANDSAVLDANCTINFTDISANMTFNSSSNLYEYSRNFSQHGTKAYEINCNHSSAEPQNATGSLYINALPNTTTVLINTTQGTNYTNEDIQCFARIEDADTSEITAIFYWYRNGQEAGSGDTTIQNATLSLIATLPYTNTTKGDIITCAVKGFDSIAYEPDEKNASIEIADAPPMFNTSNPIANQTWKKNTNRSIDLSAHFFDLDGDAMNWTASVVENITIEINNSAAKATLIPDKDFIGVRYVIFNASNQGGSALSNNITLNVTNNTIPQAVNVAINCTDSLNRTNGSLIALWEFYDADGDSQQGYELSWFKNNGTGFVEQQAFANLTIIGSGNTTKNETWKISVRVYDGETWSNWSNATIYIENALPDISISITSSDSLNRTNGTLTAVWSYSDIDGDPIQANESIWYKDGNATFFNITSVGSGNTTKGQQWTFSIRAHDGTEWSEWHNATIFIENAAPSIPTIESPSNNSYLQEVDINMSSEDIDNDTIYYYVYINGSLDTIATSNIINWSGSDGTYELRIAAYDNESFSQNSTPIIFTKDTVAPLIIDIDTSQSGTTTVTLTLEVTTNERATCRYDTEDDPYNAMDAMADSGNSLTHSHEIAFTSNASGTLYVRCMDLASNIMDYSNSTSYNVVVEEESDEGGGGGGNNEQNENRVVYVIASIAAGYTKAIDINKETIPFIGYKFGTNRDIDQLTITTEALTAKPSSVSKPSYEVYKYVEVNIDGMNNDDLVQLEIHFKVSREWADSKNIEKTGIKLLRYQNAHWQDLQTSYTKQDSTHYYYTALSPGFSIFAIVGQPTIEEETGEPIFQAYENATQQEDITQQEEQQEQPEDQTSESGGFEILPPPGLFERMLDSLISFAEKYGLWAVPIGLACLLLINITISKQRSKKKKAKTLEKTEGKIKEKVVKKQTKKQKAEKAATKIFKRLLEKISTLKKRFYKERKKSKSRIEIIKQALAEIRQNIRKDIKVLTGEELVKLKEKVRNLKALLAEYEKERAEKAKEEKITGATKEETKKLEHKTKKERIIPKKAKPKTELACPKCGSTSIGIGRNEFFCRKCGTTIAKL